MAHAVESSGTQTATVGTEHTLATPATLNTRVLSVDLTNMALGDVVELRIYVKVASGGSQVLYTVSTYAHTQIEDAVISVPVPMPYGGQFTLKQTAGTGRSFPWNIQTLE